MSVWKSDEKLLIFLSLISLSKIILFEKSIKHSTQCSITSMKYLEVRQNYSAARLIFQLSSQCFIDETLRLMLDIFRQRAVILRVDLSIRTRLSLES